MTRRENNGTKVALGKDGGVNLVLQHIEERNDHKYANLKKGKQSKMMNLFTTQSLKQRLPIHGPSRMTLSIATRLRTQQ
ncbi:hypothetical protein WDU94_007479 [Cyamophila willieti]